MSENNSHSEHTGELMLVWSELRENTSFYILLKYITTLQCSISALIVAHIDHDAHSLLSVGCDTSSLNEFLSFYQPPTTLHSSAPSTHSDSSGKNFSRLLCYDCFLHIHV